MSKKTNEQAPTSILDSIKTPADLRLLPKDQLQILADQLRHETIDAVSKVGGHLGASLGVVELTVALHYVFDTPQDRLIWDVGHQSYPHKILTGRRQDMRRVRQAGGPSGFTKRSESEYDPFGTAHSSTSISAGLGMAVARDLYKKQNNVICVIGDGAMSAGMAFEAMNNAGSLKSRLIVVLNDNDMSIATPVGAMSAYLSRLISSKSFRSIRNFAKDISTKFPQRIQNVARKAEEYTRGMITGGTLFEELGFYYVGPLDGHQMDHLLPVFENLRDKPVDGPVLVHVVTQKGKGFAAAEAASDKYHSVSKFDVKTGSQVVSSISIPSYTQVFAESLIDCARNDNRVVAITAAMPSGTGLDKFAKVFPDRCFDVGIAEQHAVTFAAGLASEGMRPFAAIYSTFLQRGYDQVIHDVAIQNLPVRFAIDRAGLVGADGATHAGAFDLCYLGCLPNFMVMAAADEIELMRMVKTAWQWDHGPSAFRYPRGHGWGHSIPDALEPLEVGKGRVIREGHHVAILSLGARLFDCMKAADILAKQGIFVTIADARFAKPFDRQLVRDLLQNHESLILIEEGALGGFNAMVMHDILQNDLLGVHQKIRCMCLPDIFFDHDTPDQQYQNAGLDAQSIVDMVLDLMDKHLIMKDLRIA